MLDFLMIAARSAKNGRTEIYPKFIIKKSSDLMIRGGDFYAVWCEDKGLWSTDEQDAIAMIDAALDDYARQNRERFDGDVRTLHLWDAESGMIDIWHKYCQKQMRDCFRPLDERIVFANDPVKKEDYASRRLPYPLQKGDISAWDRLVGTLYSAEERRKIEWAVGSIVSGESARIQKFMVLYGAAGTGKSTVLNIIQTLFDGYCCTFRAKDLGSASNAFALEAFRGNPLVAIEHDADLSRIEDNTRINSLVSHELMTVNEKFKSAYTSRFRCFLIMGTNKPVRITDAKSGLIRRLIDVTPSGNKLPQNEYSALIKQVQFELGAVAYHCRQVFESAPELYDAYVPTAMLDATNDFYNFILDAYPVFKNEDSTTLKAAWEMYKTYCEEAKVAYPYSLRVFKEELKNYFRQYEERGTLADGTRVRSLFSGYKATLAAPNENYSSDPQPASGLHPASGLELNCASSLLDELLAGCRAQYAYDGKPTFKWDNVSTALADIDTSKTHYVKPPENHIVIDFDIRGADGSKSPEENLKAASAFPPTYAELSQSGNGVHLHYIYDGDVTRLAPVYGKNIEVKTFTGNSSLRRRVSYCNDTPVAHISSGLPLREEKKMINIQSVKSEQSLRTQIRRNLNKEIHADTRSSCDFIKKILDDAFEGGLQYDVTDMRNAVLAFAANSTNQSEYCLKLVNKMRFRSEEPAVPEKANGELVFFDCEVFPNLFLVNWKYAGEGKPVMRMINPSPAEIESLMKMKLVGFNCRRYDNHILYGRLIGYTNEQLYKLSQRIISGDRDCFFGEAYNVSYTDVYDFSAKKQSLKKFEIELGIHHKELGLPWDKPVPEELWVTVAEYCDNDVLATEAVFNARRADFLAREILADVAGMTVNDTTNTLTTRIIFGKNRNPQNAFNYRFMGEVTPDCEPLTFDNNGRLYERFGDEHYTLFDKKCRPVFPGYTFENGVSTYRGEEVGEGGYVYAEPGMYTNVALLDIASMHPSSIVEEKLFGEEYTARFKELLNARIAIKHKEFDKARKMLGGKLTPYLDDENKAKDLAQALKIAINSVYGLTAATFDNPFRDVRNVDNIVAKRGALFMVNLKHEVQERGFTVAHIKTDSIKIPDATPEIIQFVMDYGRQYGYNFEHEATYERMCLVNDAVYIARYPDGSWTATGKQFAVPYVFKTLFSHEEVTFNDLCETFAVSTALYLDMDGEKQFVGKVGRFCPMLKGGTLLRQEENGKFSAPSGSKGYLWLESEMVKTLGREEDIDRSYYERLAEKAKEEISRYGDFEWFTSEEPLSEATDFDKR